MGITYHGPYADLIDAHSHEGYAARKLPTGKLTGTWTVQTRDFVGYVAVCECGWTGATVHPPTDQGEEDAELEWDRDHLGALITTAKRGWHRWADQTATALHHVADLVTDHQHTRAADVLTRLIKQLQARRRLTAEIANSGQDR